ncbi:MAG TPA: FAD-dependent oxidoreductase, partial [Dehalococcoidia bacterium]|nr:FAD-dependent oxidoreductase [Dehalococcoidia bacterium]
EFGMRALRAYPSLVAEVEAACGFEVEFRPEGILKVAFTDEQAGELRARLAWQQRLGEPIAWLDAALCRELEPRLSLRVAGGVFSHAEGSVSNQLLALGLERAGRALGVDVQERTPVTGFTRSAGRVTHVRSGGRSFECDVVVLAAGARSGQLARRLGVALPVEPVRGQMIALGGMRPPIRRIVWGPDGYLVPRANGLVFAGATVERVGFRRRTTRAGIGRLRAMARRLVPQLGAATTPFAWAGLRPGTGDGLPYIGPMARWANVIAATGHYRNGILLGPLTGKLVAAGVASGDWTEAAAFSPERGA